MDGLRAGGDLVSQLAERPPGALVELHAFRRDELHVLPVTLGAPPATTAVLSLVVGATPAQLARRTAWLGA